MRERYSGSFSLGRDTTAKEMLHCFALAYFATTEDKPSLQGLVKALCEENYSTYEKHMEYPLLPGSKQITPSQKKKVLELYEDETSAMKEFKLKMKKAAEAVKILRDKKKIRKLTQNQENELKTNLKFLSKREQEKNIKKILDDFEKDVERFSTIVSNSLREKLYQFTACEVKNNKEMPDPAAESWLKSAYWTAEVIGKKNIIGNYSDYIFAHSTSKTSRYIKERALSEAASLIAAKLEIDELKSDMFNPSDIYIIKKQSLNSIIQDYKNVIHQIITNDKQLDSKPLITLIKKHIQKKECIPISLKKSLTKNPPVHLTGTAFKSNNNLYPLSDSYSHILGYLDSDLPNLEDKIEKLITINKIKYKHNIETFDVNFTFNYSDLNKKIPELQGKNIILSDEHYSLTTASMTWNGLPTNAQGSTIGAYTGGAGFTQVAAILKKYPKANEVFEEIKTHRKNAYLLALKDYVDDPSNISIPSILNKSTILNEAGHRRLIYNSIKNNLKFNDKAIKNIYCLYLVYLNSFLLYGSVNEIEVNKIKNMLKDFSKNVTTEKIKGLIATDILRKYGWVGPDKKRLKPSPEKTIKNMISKVVIKEYSKRVHQENRCAKLEALYFYTRGKGTMSNTEYTISNDILNQFFKKQITITIYGLITKKGSKIFLTVPEIKEKQKTNPNLKQVSDVFGFRTTPYILIGNGEDD